MDDAPFLNYESKVLVPRTDTKRTKWCWDFPVRTAGPDNAFLPPLPFEAALPP